VKNSGLPVIGPRLEPIPPEYEVRLASTLVSNVFVYRA
jgi:hypothetical protein